MEISGANVELRTILRYAKYKCRDVDFQNPFLCMDALYVYGLFKYLFDYPDGEHINVSVYNRTISATDEKSTYNCIIYIIHIVISDCQNCIWKYS